MWNFLFFQCDRFSSKENLKANDDRFLKLRCEYLTVNEKNKNKLWTTEKSCKKNGVKRIWDFWLELSLVTRRQHSVAMEKPLLHTPHTATVTPIRKGVIEVSPANPTPWDSLGDLCLDVWNCINSTGAGNKRLIVQFSLPGTQICVDVRNGKGRCCILCILIFLIFVTLLRYTRFCNLWLDLLLLLLGLLFTILCYIWHTSTCIITERNHFLISC